MIKNGGALWALFALIAIAGFGLRLDLAAPYHRHHGPDQRSQAPKNDNLPADYMAPALALGQFVDAHNGAVNALAAIVIAAFTIVLAVRTGGLFKETAALRAIASQQQTDMLRSVTATEKLATTGEKSASVAERALVELEAPFLAINILDTGILREAALGGVYVRKVLRFTIANYGRTPAMLMELVDKAIIVHLTAGLPPEINLDFRSRNSMSRGVIAPPSNSSQHFIYDLDAQNNILIGAKELDDLYGGQLRLSKSELFYYGFVRYRTIFDQTFRMGFCFIFDKRGNHWHLAGGDRYNYLEKES
jgi:hypothetical protein